jgi:hypothetical protein
MADLRELADQAAEELLKGTAEELLKGIRDQARKAGDTELLHSPRRIRWSFRPR